MRWTCSEIVGFLLLTLLLVCCFAVVLLHALAGH